MYSTPPLPPTPYHASPARSLYQLHMPSTHRQLRTWQNSYRAVVDLSPPSSVAGWFGTRWIAATLCQVSRDVVEPGRTDVEMADLDLFVCCLGKSGDGLRVVGFGLR